MRRKAKNDKREQSSLVSVVVSLVEVVVIDHGDLPAQLYQVVLLLEEFDAH
jgi:hypothetical protein